MDEHSKKEYTKAIGIDLILGVAVGYSLGLIFSGASLAPVYAGVGAGIGIITGAMTGYIKIKRDKKKFV